MTKDEIIEIANKAGIVVTGEAIYTLCKLVAQHEREACARVCEQHGYDHYCGNVTDKLAETIRARGNT